MMRLIDADTTKVSITRYFETHIRNLKANHSLIGNILKAQMKEVCTDVCFGIDAQQTVDAVPVVHGEWQNRRTWTHDGEWYCTACDKEITIYMGEKRGNDRYKYCPNCGARMDGAE